jgi:hypothetical protein
MIDRGDGGAAIVALRSSVWCRDQGKWCMTFHQITPVS